MSDNFFIVSFVYSEFFKTCEKNICFVEKTQHCIFYIFDGLQNGHYKEKKSINFYSHSMFCTLDEPNLLHFEWN